LEEEKIKIITRCSKHILKYSNSNKIDDLEQLYQDYKKDLQLYIDLILSGQLELKPNLSSKLLPTNIFSHSQWKQIVYKNASEIVRSNKKIKEKERYKRYKKVYTYFSRRNRQQKFLSKYFIELNLKNILSYIHIEIKNVSISIDERLIDFDNSTLHFNEFVRVKLPYFQEDKKRAETINLPIKWHKSSLKFVSWKRKKTVQLQKIKRNFHLVFFYEKEEPEKREEGRELGIDIGYKKLVVASDGGVYGKDLGELYERISRKKSGSKKSKRLLKERDKKVNEIINQINLGDVVYLFVEDLKDVKKGGGRGKKRKIHRKFMSKLQHWTYPRVVDKFERRCEDEGISLEKVSPAYTSQICSDCGSKDKNNRKGEKFKCLECGFETDADLNASVNILHRGVYNLSTKENLNFV